MRNLIEEIKNQEESIARRRKEFDAEKERVLSTYREKAHSEIQKMRQQSEKKRKTEIEIAKQDASEEILKRQPMIDEREQFLQKTYEKNKNVAREILIEEVLFNGDR